MIRVNLLPPEYRKPEGTPLARFLAIVVGVVVSASAIGTFLYVHFGVLVKYTSQREQKEVTYFNKKALADRSLSLENELQEYKKRRDTIEKIGKNRILWSRKLDEFADLIHNKGQNQRHFVWLKSLRIQPTGGAGKTPTGGTLVFSGFSAYGFDKLSAFHEDVKDSEFFQDFVSINNPEGTEISFTDHLEPAKAWEFNFDLLLKPFGWRKDGKRK